MNKEDMILISVDDHTVEPPNMFKNHLASKYLDDAPRLVHNPDGSDMWKFRDTVIPNVALNAVAGRPKEEYGIEPTGLDEIRPGCYNVDERIKDMNAGESWPRSASRPFRDLPRDCSPPTIPISRSRWCRPITTGTSTNGAVRIQRGSSRWRSRSSGMPRRVRPRCGGCRRRVCTR
ncbi:hypothetical protein NIIDMKKI_08060 [Mycobacterium kansasii]|uniref:Amidohydrolase family protein n=1 Tax=Mycobacterium kansasii TaxID=1768 RepID=A0A7G1I3J3_MYCKA|nr:hypothetical protein NIIDMKKI_08060 [Mycobacterium kansasii]